MNDTPRESTPQGSSSEVSSAQFSSDGSPVVAHPDPLEAKLRTALSAPDGVAERLVRRALQVNADGATSTGRLPGRRGRTWTVATATVLCLTLLWMTSPIWRSTPEPPEISVQLVDSRPEPTEKVQNSHAARRHLRLSNTGDVVQLTAPSGNTLLIVASAPTSRR